MDVKSFLTERQTPFEVLPHAWAKGASRLAESVHVPGLNVAKTVLLHVDHGFRDVVAVLPANLRIDPDEVSQMLGGAEVKFGNAEDVAQRCPDCERGVLPPFGSKYGMSTIADESLAQCDQIVFECNTHEEAVRMKWNDFRRLENPLVGRFAVAESREA